MRYLSQAEKYQPKIIVESPSSGVLFVKRQEYTNRTIGWMFLIIVLFIMISAVGAGGDWHRCVR